MNVAAERTTSLWMATADLPSAPALAEDIAADIVVVGGGIAGLSVAYEAARRGHAVVVVDRGRIGGGMTARTSAHLTSSFDDYYHEHIRMRGLDEARAYYHSQSAAIDRIEDIQQTEGLSCGFARVDGYMFLAPGTDPMLLDREIEACHRVGFDDVAWVDRAPFGTSATGRCLKFPRQGRFHPIKYVSALVSGIRRAGGQIYADTPVTAVEEAGSTVSIRTNAGPRLSAGAAVIATNSPIVDRVAIHTKQAPYRTYVIAIEVPSGSVADALYWDTLDAYHYVRIEPGTGGTDVLIVGGEDHKTGTADDFDDRFRRLEAWTREHVPSAGTVVHRWSGQVMEPVDLAPYIGRNPGNDNVYVATGDSGEGLTTGVVAGMLIADLIDRRDNPWAVAYDPRRISLKSATEYVKENATMVANLAEYLTRGEVASLDQLAPGEGAIVRQGAKKLAAYRDEAGALHVNSAVCTHAGCIIHWNALERCWDCPCHGSQFSIDGEPLTGPAMHRLAPPPESEA